MSYAFGILPTIIRQDGRVSDFACRLFSEVDSLSNKYGYCFATNKALGKALSKSTATISRTLAELEALNYVNILIEDGYKRKIYPRRDFREFEGVVENEQGGTQKCVGGYSDLSRGVVKNDMTANKNNLIRKQNKNNIKPQNEIEEKENDILAIVHDQINETAVKVVEIIPSKAKKQAKYIYPPTIEELVQPIYEKLIEKKRIHPNIVDCWNWANHQAEAFWLYQDKMGWKVEKLNGAIATWINKAIQYKTVVVPCPIQYKGNPANAQPAQPTKVHVEETKSPEQSKEARKAMFAAAKAELNHIGA